MNKLPLLTDQKQIDNLGLTKVTTSLRDSLIAWEIVNDRWRSDVHHEFSTSEEIFFFDECEADEFKKVMNEHGLDIF